MNTITETHIVSPEEVGTIITKLALADQGFLVLLLTAASKVECHLPPEDFRKLAVWGKNVHTLGASSSDDHSCH